MGEGVQKKEAFITSTISTLTITTLTIISSTIESSTFETFTSLPPLSSPIPTSLPVSTISPTYSTIMREPITTLFSSQSTKVERVVQEKEPNDDDIMVSFYDLQFEPEEDNVPDNMIMSGKQFEILKKKINSLLQLQGDSGGRSSIYGVDME
ncbi:unnamed protein product [Lactuca virosa]|uniref:Uncharacterized protein n=1 Tax=Lactuca virosa TaxID=75947 RepID=A0AAU9PF12_9ASTR|nr:unnamed protein product [Lactuca virosa]